MNMKNEELKELVHSYGANLQRWPWDLRDSARRMFNANPELLAEAAELDRTLDEFTLAADGKNADTALLNLIVQSAKRQVDETGATGIIFIFRPAWAKTAMLLFCALSGLFLGSLNLNSNSAVKMAANYNQEIFDPTIINEVLP